MLKKGQRLRNEEIRQIKKQGACIQTPLFSFFYTPLKRGDESRFTCVVSRRVAQKAVDRNKIKRRCREAVRRAFDPKVPVAGVFVLKKRARGAAYKEFIAEMHTLPLGIRKSAK